MGTVNNVDKQTDVAYCYNDFNINIFGHFFNAYGESFERENVRKVLRLHKLEM